MNDRHSTIIAVASLGVDLALHEQLMTYNARLHERTHLSQPNRPMTMALFDRAAHEVHGDRVATIAAYRKRGGKSIGTFCIYIPDEIALAADVLPIPAVRRDAVVGGLCGQDVSPGNLPAGPFYIRNGIQQYLPVQETEGRCRRRDNL